MEESFKNGLLADDELMEYARLWPIKTGIMLDIFVDDGKAYKRWGHPLWVYVRNGYGGENNFFHVNVSDRPTAPNIKYNINKLDLEAVLHFIRINAKLLDDFANERIEHAEFYSLCKPVICPRSNAKMNEMSTLRPQVSGLPTVLWIDEGTNPQHGPRIKFQASKEQMTTRSFSSMSISQNPQIYNLPKNCTLTKDELEAIMNFVKNNEVPLLKLANGEMQYQDFLATMLK